MGRAEKKWSEVERRNIKQVANMKRIISVNTLLSPRGLKAPFYSMTRAVRAISYLVPSDRLSSSYQDPERSHILKKEEKNKHQTG